MPTLLLRRSASSCLLAAVALTAPPALVGEAPAAPALGEAAPPAVRGGGLGGPREAGRGEEDEGDLGNNATLSAEGRRLEARHASARLYYSMPTGTSLGTSADKMWYSMLVPRHTAADTYFSVLSHDMGYMGLQQIHFLLGFRGRAIFSIWDPQCRSLMNPDDCPEEARAKMVECGERAVCDRFGHEGTGVRTYMNFNEWNVEMPYGFLVQASSAGPGRVRYDGYFHASELNGWILLGKVEVPIGVSASYINRPYSFVEQFTGNSFEDLRWGRFGPSFVRSGGAMGSWVQVQAAQFRVEAGPGEVATHVKANVTNNGQQWGMGVDFGSRSTASGQMLRVGSAGVPPQLRQFDSLRAAGLLPTGCAGRTCFLTAVEATLMNHLGLIVLVILPGILLLGCGTCYLIAPQRFRQKLSRGKARYQQQQQLQQQQLMPGPGPYVVPAGVPR